MRVTGRSNLVDVDGLEIIHETERAFLVTNHKIKVWVPKSAVEFDGRHTFTMPENMAFEKGLI